MAVRGSDESAASFISAVCKHSTGSVDASTSSCISPPSLMSVGVLKRSYFLNVTPSFSGENSFPCVLQPCLDPEDGDSKLLRSAGNDLALDTLSYGGRLVSPFCCCPHPVKTRYHHHHHHHHHHPCCHLYAVYYSYISETNHLSILYSAAAVL